MIPFWWIALHLIFVHGPDNQAIELNIAEISSIREPRKSEGHFHQDVKCLVIMTNGKFIGVIEPCPAVLEKIREVQPPN
jgi:hypothetical protein